MSLKVDRKKNGGFPPGREAAAICTRQDAGCSCRGRSFNDVRHARHSAGSLRWSTAVGIRLLEASQLWLMRSPHRPLVLPQPATASLPGLRTHLWTARWYPRATTASSSSRRTIDTPPPGLHRRRHLSRPHTRLLGARPSQRQQGPGGVSGRRQRLGRTTTTCSATRRVGAASSRCAKKLRPADTGLQGYATGGPAGPWPAPARHIAVSHPGEATRGQSGERACSGRVRLPCHTSRYVDPFHRGFDAWAGISLQLLCSCPDDAATTGQNAPAARRGVACGLGRRCCLAGRWDSPARCESGCRAERFGGPVAVADRQLAVRGMQAFGSWQN